VRPGQFFDLAILLKGGPASPQAYRTAISRAYYAVFHLGAVTLKAVGIQIDAGPGAHGQLRNCLGALNDPDLEDARDLLRELHGRRIAADYRLDDARLETRNEADTACQEAADAIAIFEALSKDPASKDTAVKAMKQYARNTAGLRVT
jgi:HEPN domain